MLTSRSFPRRVTVVVRRLHPVHVDRHCATLRETRATLGQKNDGHVHHPRRKAFSGATTKRVKRRSTVKFDDLPQGTIPLDTASVEVELPPYPTVILQAQSHMRKFDTCVLLTRVGGFYELYFEHATEFAPLLELKLASKETKRGLVPMVRAIFWLLIRV
jgi:hypothetical protein